MALKDIELEHNDDIIGLRTLLRMFKEHRNKDCAFSTKRLPDIKTCYFYCKLNRDRRIGMEGYWHNMMCWISDIKVSYNLGLYLHYYVTLLKQVSKEKLIKETTPSQRRFMGSLIKIRFISIIDRTGLVSKTHNDYGRVTREIMGEVDFDDIQEAFDKLDYTDTHEFHYYRDLINFIENANLRDKIPF